MTHYFSVTWKMPVTLSVVQEIHGIGLPVWDVYACTGIDTNKFFDVFYNTNFYFKFKFNI